MPGPLIVSLAGTQLLPKERELLKHKNVGGIVLFRANYDKDSTDPKLSLKKLIAEIRSINPDIMIMVDHEGGNVWRFIKENKAIKSFDQLPNGNEKGAFTKLIAAAILGVKYDKDKAEALRIAFENGKIVAEELLDCGVDINLAPVVDLDGESNVIGKLFRAFHKDPNVVAEIAEQFIRGMNSVGMPGTLKHFPGHGSCIPDSHNAKPIDNRTLAELQKDLLPFKKLLSKSDLNLSVMTAHVTYPAVDPDKTAGSSSIWIQGALRAGCGFDGVVMSDCLSMEGAAVGNTIIDRIIAAQTAGNDFQMFTQQHNTVIGNKLDELLAILDQIPDNKHSAERRQALLNSVKRRKIEFAVPEILPQYVAAAAVSAPDPQAETAGKDAKPRSVLD